MTLFLHMYVRNQQSIMVDLKMEGMDIHFALCFPQVAQVMIFQSSALLLPYSVLQGVFLKVVLQKYARN